VICGYRLKGQTLTLWRPWVEGVTAEKYFEGLTVRDRLDTSRSFFRRVTSKLEKKGFRHGALHARNLIILDENAEIEVVDAIFNSVSLNPCAVLENEPWLWGPSVPQNMPVESWDRVSLMRTAALLAAGPSLWSRTVARDEAIELTRDWIGDYIRSFPEGADLVRGLEKDRRLLDLISEAVFALPPQIQTDLEESDREEQEEALTQRIQGCLFRAQLMVVKGHLAEAQEILEEIFY
jgi:hypothetical protein